MTNEIVKQTPSDLISLAVEKGADLEKLEKLLTLKERWESGEAKKAYHQAMSKFKLNPPKITKDKQVSYGAGKTSYKHASLANVTEKINTELSKHGLSASWSIQQNGSVSVTCKITHNQGHSEETTLSAPSDTSGSKNAIQAIGSTISYLSRYSLLCITGLSTSDMDDDGHAASTELIDDKQKGVILDFINDKSVNLEKFLVYMKVDSVDSIPKSKYQQAVTALKNKR
jgi:hypothetical protein